MWSDLKLLEFFRNEETDLVERKRNSKDPSDIQQAICAFSNDLPSRNRTGVIFVGQENDRSCANIAIDDQLLLRLAGLRDDGRIQPLPTMSVERKQFDNCTVAVIQVEPSYNPPVKFDGRIWVRVGPRRAQASPEEERRLIEKRRWGNLAFDAQAVVNSTIRDLDLRRFELEFLPSVVPPDILAANNRLLDQQLRALRLINKDDVPTLSGILFLGTSPLSWIPGAYVQFLRIDGPNLVDPIVDQRTISGTLADQVRQLDELAALNIRTRVSVRGSTRTERPDYPIEALRQLLRNAVVHRTYEGTNSPIRVTL